MADVWSMEAWEEETLMNKLLGTFTRAMLLATHLITTAAGPTARLEAYRQRWISCSPAI
jgi:hypothetical protein